MRTKLLHKLKDELFNVDLRLGEALVEPESKQETENEKENESDESKKKEQVVEKRYLEGKRTIKTSKGNEIECDLLFYCNGASVNRMKDEAFLQGVINEKNGRIIVRKSLQIQKEKCDNIFAFGDCADNAPQFAYIAGEQAKTVAHNIKVLSQGRETELKEFHMGKYAMVLTLGKKKME